MTGTTQELAERMGTDYQTALAVIRFLEHKGIVIHAGKKSSKTGKGKASNLFSVPEGVLKITLIEKTEK